MTVLWNALRITMHLVNTYILIEGDTRQTSRPKTLLLVGLTIYIIHQNTPSPHPRWEGWGIHKGSERGAAWVGTWNTNSLD